MASTESTAFPLGELQANWQQTVQDGPSPLRIVKHGGTRSHEETTTSEGSLTNDVTWGGPSSRAGADLHTALKRRRPEEIRQMAGKENCTTDGKFGLSHGPEADPLGTMQDAKRWAWDDSPPQLRRGLGLSSGALTVRKTRRGQCQLKES